MVIAVETQRKQLGPDCVVMDGVSEAVAFGLDFQLSTVGKKS